MLEKKKISIYYFSNTGNTYIIGKKVCETFISNGYEAAFISMRTMKPKDIPIDDIIGLAFPVAIQSTYPFVWDFVSKMPKVNGTKIFMLDTMEQFSGGVVGPMKKQLSDKGYIGIGAKEFKLPSSIRKKEKKKQNVNQIINKSENEAVAYVKAMIDEKTHWRRVPILSDLVRCISKPKIIWEKISIKSIVENNHTNLFQNKS